MKKINWNRKLKGNQYSRLWLYTEIKKIISIYPIYLDFEKFSIVLLVDDDEINEWSEAWW